MTHFRIRHYFWFLLLYVLVTCRRFIFPSTGYNLSYSKMSSFLLWSKGVYRTILPKNSASIDASLFYPFFRRVQISLPCTKMVTTSSLVEKFLGPNLVKVMFKSSQYLKKKFASFFASSFSSTALCDFWLAQLFLSVASSPASFVSNWSLPSSSSHSSHRLPILLLAFPSVLLHTVSIYIWSWPLISLVSVEYPFNFDREFHNRDISNSLLVVNICFFAQIFHMLLGLVLITLSSRIFLVIFPFQNCVLVFVM